MSASTNDLGKIPMATHKKKKKKKSYESLSEEIIALCEQAYDKMIAEVTKAIPKKMIKDSDKDDDFFFLRFTDKNKQLFQLGIWADESISDRFTIREEPSGKEIHSSKDFKKFIQKLKSLV